MDKKPLFKAPYDLKDVSILFSIVALFLIITAVLGNNLFGIFQESVNFGWKGKNIISLNFLLNLQILL